MNKATDVRQNWKEVLDTVAKTGRYDFWRAGVQFTIVRDYDKTAPQPTPRPQYGSPEHLREQAKKLNTDDDWKEVGSARLPLPPVKPKIIRQEDGVTYTDEGSQA